MSERAQGSNLPTFRSVQLDFAAHIRNPEVNPRPFDVEARRMQIYLDLFFRNIESFLAGAFPVAKETLGEERWLKLAREFVHRHPSESPYFLQISQEFLAFLYERDGDDLPGFLLELCHYEWVELSLDVANEPEYPAFDPNGDIMGRHVVSAAARMLTYDYPVHKIGPDHRPEAPDAAATHLIVYRRPDLKVRFMESNAMTHRLLALLKNESADRAIALLTDELREAGYELSRERVQEQAIPIIEKLKRLGILLGTIESV